MSDRMVEGTQFCLSLKCFNWFEISAYLFLVLFQVKPLCPLCKKSFTSILHNVDAMNGYDVHKLLPTTEDAHDPLAYILGPFHSSNFEQEWEDRILPKIKEKRWNSKHWLFSLFFLIFIHYPKIKFKVAICFS